MIIEHLSDVDESVETGVRGAHPVEADRGTR